MKKILQLLLIVIITILSSCKKNEVTTTPDPIIPFENAKTITTIVAGKVTAQDGTALNNVEITIGTSTTVTDANGNFIIPKAILSEKAGFIKATKSGYFGGSRTIIAKEKVINNVVIQLIKKTISGDFTNANGGTITVATGGSVVFPANAVVTKSGAAYSGTVKVSAYFLDPTSSSCYKEMPGDLRGINASNNEQVLTSYGMMAVELNGSNGEALQLATGKSATVTFPIAAAIKGAAPTTIPLWFFDETKGMWVEQGSATKTGNNYVGTVSHFTWWNCDWGGGPIKLTATFVDQNGNPLSNYHVWMLPANSSSGGGHGMTATDGSLTGNVPANEAINIKIESNSYCGIAYAVLYTATVGPFTQNTNPGNITVNLTTQAPSTISIKGTVLDCSNNPVASGYAIVHFNNQSYYAHIYNGAFSFTNTFCTNAPTGTATIDVFDLSTLKKNTTPSTINISGSGVFNIGQIAACGVQVAVHYTASFVDQNGASFAGFYVNFSGDTTFNIYPQTNTINAIIPANKVLIRKTFAYTNCGGYVLVDSTQIGPFATDFNAGTISITVPQPSSFIISGTVKDCSNNPVALGYAVAQINGQNFSSIISNGSFSIPVSRCNSNATNATIIVIDNATQQQNSSSISPSVSNSNINIGVVQACGINLDEFLNYSFDGITYNADSLQAYQQNNISYITGYVSNPNSNIAANFNGLIAGIGTYTINVSLNVSTGTYLTSNNVTNATVASTITEYGNIGQFIAGTFTGNLLQSGTTITKPITGSFRFRRTQ